MSNCIHVTSLSGEQTEVLARTFADLLTPGCIVSLEGDLGAGKTFFTRALLRQLGVTERVTSPTFVLQKIYRLADCPISALVHYDLYRIGGYDELLETGFEELLDGNASFVEWGDKFCAEYPVLAIRIEFSVTGPDSRSIRIVAEELPRLEGFGEKLRGEGLEVAMAE